MPATVRNILHLTPHLGGGVGRVLQNLINAWGDCGGYRHSIACLDYANDYARRWSEDCGIQISDNCSRNQNQLNVLISQADIVHLHWWNHPLLYKFMHQQNTPEFRIVIWSHVNGVSAPHQIIPEIISYSDIFTIATPYSLQAKAVSRINTHEKKDKLRLIFSCSGYEHVLNVKHQPHEGFNVGYIGTVSYAKMHRDFLKMSASIKIPEAKFIICGGDDDEAISQESKRYPTTFEFHGKVENITTVLPYLDVFGYPLCPENYGTGEQALIEALACGIPAVCFDNGCERHIVEDGRSGFLVNSPDEYAQAVEFLYSNPQRRKEMGAYAKTNTRKRFAISNTINAWTLVYDELMNRAKAKHLLFPGEDLEGYELFLNALGDCNASGMFRDLCDSISGQSQYNHENLAKLPPVFFSTSNGSLIQYANFFPDDKKLQRIRQVLIYINNGLNNTNPKA